MRFDEQLAADLLEIGAVSINAQNPYTWASGLRSPIYCDNRLTIGFPSIRRLITQGFVDVIEREGYQPAVVVGTATAGIPHAAWLADRLELPLAYVRSGVKAHGKGNRVEGRVEPGAEAILIEDLISTGGSSLGAVEALREDGAVVHAVLSVFSYGLEASREAFQQQDVRLHALTDLQTLLGVARRTDQLDTAAEETLTVWQRDPQAWSEGRRA